MSDREDEAEFAGFEVVAFEVLADTVGGDVCDVAEFGGDALVEDFDGFACDAGEHHSVVDGDGAGADGGGDGGAGEGAGGGEFCEGFGVVGAFGGEVRAFGDTSIGAFAAVG